MKETQDLGFIIFILFSDIYKWHTIPNEFTPQSRRWR